MLGATPWRALLAVLALCLLTATAQARRIPKYADDAEFLSAGSAAAIVTNLSVTTGFTARSVLYPGGATKEAYFHFVVPPDTLHHLSQNVLSVKIRWRADAASVNVCFRASMGNASLSADYVTGLTYSATQTSTAVTPATVNRDIEQVITTAIGPPFQLSAPPFPWPAVLRLERAHGAPGCANDATASVRVDVVSICYPGGNCDL